MTDAANIWPFGNLERNAYGAILADPPWAYRTWSENGLKKSPEGHYSTLAWRDIGALPVGQLAGRDCLLFLWSTWPHLRIAQACMAAWGFTYKTGGAWKKTTPSGKTAFGTGYILRSATEPFLVGTIGSPTIAAKNWRNLIEAERREHSRKPGEARRMLEALLPDARRCELFAREGWAGNDVWGNQTGRFDAENADG
jgi:N6-adenosine-specific RNA methylase IME4